MTGSASPAWLATVRTHAPSWSRTFSTIGLSRRMRNLATGSALVLRRMTMMTARSSIVSGRSPIPASTAMAKVSHGSVSRMVMSHRM